MTAWIGKWLLGVALAALAASLAETLVSQGPIRRVLRLAGGILVAAALLRPLGTVPLEALGAVGANYRQQVDELTETYRQEGNQTLSGVIAEELAAYIVDKAESLGLETQAQVTVEADGEGTPLPREVRLTIPRDQELAQWLAEELGIPEEAQYWQEE